MMAAYVPADISIWSVLSSFVLLRSRTIGSLGNLRDVIILSWYKHHLRTNCGEQPNLD